MDDEINKQLQEAFTRFSKINDAERLHLGFILTVLADCYGEDAATNAVITFRRKLGGTSIMGVNSTEMDMAQLLTEAAGIMSHALVLNAPPKEMFN
jgi:hypothetical protein